MSRLQDIYKYQGAGLLQLSDLLKNYNDSIAHMVKRYAPPVTENGIVDFGAGIGTLSVKVRAHGLNPICVEPDAEQREELKRRGLVSLESIDCIEDGTLDYIYSSNVLEHIEDDEGCLLTLNRKLRPGGVLFLYLPALQALYSSMDSAVGHFRRYDAPSLAVKLENAEFRVREMFFADFLGFFATLLFKWLGNTTSNMNSTSLLAYDRCIFPIGCVIERLARVPFGKNIVAVAFKPL